MAVSEHVSEPTTERDWLAELDIRPVINASATLTALGGSLMPPPVRGWVADNLAVIRPALAASAQQLDDVDVDLELLWDSPEEVTDGHFYAWLAGEAAAIKP